MLLNYEIFFNYKQASFIDIELYWNWNSKGHTFSTRPRILLTRSLSTRTYLLRSRKRFISKIIIWLRFLHFITKGCPCSQTKRRQGPCNLANGIRSLPISSRTHREKCQGIYHKRKRRIRVGNWSEIIGKMDDWGSVWQGCGMVSTDHWNESWGNLGEMGVTVCWISSNENDRVPYPH